METIPDLQEEEDSSDDETYVDKEIEDIDLIYVEDSSDSDEGEMRKKKRSG
jgi:hypothetical protein